MRVQAEPTEILVTLDGVPCRCWNAITEDNQHLFLFVHRVASRDEIAEYVASGELVEVEAPKVIR